MEALEDQLSEPLEADKSPDSHFRAHEVNRYRKMQYLDGGKEVHLAKLSTFTSIGIENRIKLSRVEAWKFK